MPNMSLVKNQMPTQSPEERIKNFDEVALGYTEEQAIDEAKRCLNCKNRMCIQGCPVKIAIPDFIAKVAEGQFEEAYQIILKSSSIYASHSSGHITRPFISLLQKVIANATPSSIKLVIIKHFVIILFILILLSPTIFFKILFTLFYHYRANITIIFPPIYLVLT